MPRSIRQQQDVTDSVTDLFGWRFCLTSIAPTLYVFFVYGASALLVFHVVLTIYWRPLEIRVFPFDGTTVIQEPLNEKGPILHY